MKKILLLGLFAIFSYGITYAFEASEGDSAEQVRTDTSVMPDTHLNIRPKVEITENIVIPLAEPCIKSPVEPVEDNKDTSSLVSEDKNKEEIEISNTELSQEKQVEPDPKEVFTEKDFVSEEEIILEISPHANDIKTESKKVQPQNTYVIDKRDIMVMPYSNTSGSIYRP